MSFPASTPDLVLLATIWAAQKDRDTWISEEKLVEAFYEVERTSGEIVYGSVRRLTRESVQVDLLENLNSLEKRSMIERKDGSAKVSFIGIATAHHLELNPPFDEMKRLLRP